MNILYLELSAKELKVLRDFYADVLELPVELDSSMLKVRAGKTDLTFTQAPTEFDGAYHFAFNIPENQFHTSKEWIASRIPLLRDESG
jgi:catechol-2,3-dioxygenase